MCCFQWSQLPQLAKGPRFRMLQSLQRLSEGMACTQEFNLIHQNLLAVSEFIRTHPEGIPDDFTVYVLHASAATLHCLKRVLCIVQIARPYQLGLCSRSDQSPVNARALTLTLTLTLTVSFASLRCRQGCASDSRVERALPFSP